MSEVLDEPKERFTLMLPASLKRRLEKIVPARERSQFISDLVDEALRTRAREALRERLKRGPLAKWEGGPTSLDILREVRRDMAGGG